MKAPVLLILAGVVFAGAGPVFADSMETTATPPTAVISPWTYWTDPTSGRFYRPTGIQVGNSYFLYVEGGAYRDIHTGPGSETCTSSGEKILAFSTNWTATALRSPFNYVGAVSPCINASNVHFQPGSAFRSSTDGLVKLLVDDIEGGTNVMHRDFKRVLLGSSSHGSAFTWSTFLKQSVVGGGTYSPYLVKLVQATATSNWWGTFWWAVCHKCDGMVYVQDGDLITESGRITVTMDSTNPRGYVVTILSGGVWQRVNDDGTFNFAPDVTSDILTQSIVRNNGAWEEWGDTGQCTATQGCYVGTPGCSTFVYRTTTPLGITGPLQQVTSQVRPMPTREPIGRTGPFRMQDMNGARLIYSTSGDRLCETDPGGYRGGTEIIVTEVNN